MSLSQHLIMIQSDQDLCTLTKSLDSIEYTNEQGQSREEQDETVQMYGLILTFAILMQEDLNITQVEDYFLY